MNYRFVSYWLFIPVLALYLLSGCSLPGNQDASVDISTLAGKTSDAIPALATSPTPLRPTSGPAVLGGLLGAFVRKFGPPNDHSDPSFDSYTFKRYPSSNSDYLRIVGDIGAGKQWSPYVYLIVVSAPPHQPWDGATADATCSSFLPLDARYVSQMLDIDRQGNLQGANIIYYSAALKDILPAAQFNDAQQNPVERGLLDVYYSFAGGNENTIDECTLTPGAAVG